MPDMPVDQIASDYTKTDECLYTIPDSTACALKVILEIHSIIREMVNVHSAYESKIYWIEILREDFLR